MIFSKSTDALCNTSIISLPQFFPNHNVYLQLESYNLAMRMINTLISDAMQQNVITPNTIVVAPYDKFSLALAQVAASKLVALMIVIPQNLPNNEILELQSLGAEIIQSNIIHLQFHNNDTNHSKIIKFIKSIQIPNKNIWTPNFDSLNELISTTIAKDITQEFSKGLDYIILPIINHELANEIAKSIKQELSSTKIFISCTNNITHSFRLIRKNNKLMTKSSVLSHIDGIVVPSKERAMHITSIFPMKTGLPVNLNIGVALNSVEKLINHYKIPTDKSILSFQSFDMTD